MTAITSLTTDEEQLEGELLPLLGRLGPRNRLRPLWGSDEHITIGDEITLFFSKTDIRPANSTKLTFGDGHALTYGQILALGGDFYGLPGAPISEGGGSIADFQETVKTIETFLTRAPALFTLIWPLYLVYLTQFPAILLQTRAFLTTPARAKDPARPGYFLPAQDLFEQAFASLANAPRSEVQGVLELIAKDGQDGSDVKAEMIETYHYALQTHGRYMALLLTNWDHFGRNAWTAHRAGHAAALAQAIEARRTQKPEDLELAFAMNAFADHYLSDLFSGGHIRTPRRHLSEQSALGSLAAMWMHNEDCENGVLVRNQRGDCWVAYGDGSYDINLNGPNRHMLFRAVQSSANEISEAFVTGLLPDRFRAESLIPDIGQAEQHTEQNHLATAINGAPMFVLDPGQGQAQPTVQIRKDLGDPFCWSWRGGWDGSHLFTTVRSWLTLKGKNHRFYHPGQGMEESPVPLVVSRYFPKGLAEPPEIGYGHIAMHLPDEVDRRSLSVEGAALPLQVDGAFPVVLYRLNNRAGYAIYFLQLEKEGVVPPQSSECLGPAFYAFDQPAPGLIPIYIYSAQIEGGLQIYDYSSRKDAPPPGYPNNGSVAFYVYPSQFFGGRGNESATPEG